MWCNFSLGDPGPGNNFDPLAYAASAQRLLATNTGGLSSATMSVLKAAQDANTAFSEIQIMFVRPIHTLTPFSSIFHFRDLKDIGDPRPEIQEALATRIQDACINVGFFYGAMFLCFY